MAASLDDVKKRILGRVPLTGLIGETVRLVSRSGQSLGLCPFHPEKSPSFNVYDDHYHCYGCSAHGDAITFIRQSQGLGYVEALRHLAGKYGVEVPELDETRGRLDRARKHASLYKMMADTQELFVSCLHGPGGEAALAYLAGRGFQPDSIKAYGFGLTPPEGFGLVRYLRDKGYREEDMMACSLAKTSDRSGRPYDFFRGRVMLPIHDGQGRLIAFGGRTVDGAQPKYVNSGDSALFDKSLTLFGFDKARKVMRERGRAIVTEGYMDTLQLWQAGLPEAVACLGTAFNEHHLRHLAKATTVVYLLMDGDRAGHEATMKTVTVALAVPSAVVRAVSLPGGDDPDDFVRKHGAAALEPLFAEAPELVEFVVREKLKATHAFGVPELVSKEFVPWLARVPERIQRDFLVSRIANLTGIPASSIERELTGASSALAGAAATRQGRSPPAPVETPLAPPDPVTLELLGHAYHASPGEIDLAALRAATHAEFEIGPEHQGLLDEFLACLESGGAPAARPTGAWTGTFTAGLATLVERLAAAAPAYACKDRPTQIQKLLTAGRRRSAKAHLSRLKAEIPRLAADPARSQELAQLLKQVSDLARSVGN